MDLSVIIPARKEEFLKRTIDSTLSAARAETEVIAILDGYWPNPPVLDDKRVTLIHHVEPVGQRGGINEAARLSKAKYILKTDGHSMFDEGFDVKLMADCQYDWTIIPRMYNLHAFDWECPECGTRTYQGPRIEVCGVCKKRVRMERVMVWEIRRKRRTDYMYMNNELRAKYYGRNAKNIHKTKDKIDSVMTGQGACWFMHKDRFWDLGGMDEKHGSWGQVGVEVACKAWLSGGRLVVNKNTWFSHLFRTQGGFSFPYRNAERNIRKARQYSRDLWLNNKWSLQKRDFSWLIKKFAPVPSWNGEYE